MDDASAVGDSVRRQFEAARGDSPNDSHAGTEAESVELVPPAPAASTPPQRIGIPVDSLASGVRRSAGQRASPSPGNSAESSAMRSPARGHAVRQPEASPSAHAPSPGKHPAATAGRRAKSAPSVQAPNPAEKQSAVGFGACCESPPSRSPAVASCGFVAKASPYLVPAFSFRPSARAASVKALQAAAERLPPAEPDCKPKAEQDRLPVDHTCCPAGIPPGPGRQKCSVVGTSRQSRKDLVSNVRHSHDSWLRLRERKNANECDAREECESPAQKSAGKTEASTPGRKASGRAQQAAAIYLAVGRPASARAGGRGPSGKRGVVGRRCGHNAAVVEGGRPARERPQSDRSAAEVFGPTP